MKKTMWVALSLALCASARADIRALTPQPADATRPWWMPRHEQCLAAVTNTPRDIVFLGDSITHNWRSPKEVLNLGFGGDRTEHVLWRITEGRELDGYQAKFVSVLIGSNNTGHFPVTEEPPVDTILGVRKVVQTVLAKQTNAIVVLNALFPRGTNAMDACRLRNDIVNREIRKFTDRKRVFWCDIADRFLEPDGTLPKRLFPDGLHPSAEGYAIWQEELKPYVEYALSDRTGPAPKERTSKSFAPAQPKRVAEATPVSRIFPWWIGKGKCWVTERLLEKRNEIAALKDRRVDVVLLGDSITHSWESTGKTSLAELRKRFSVLDIGDSGDVTQSLLWRIENGELDGYRARWIELLIGTNNANANGKPENIVAGVRRILDVIAEKQPQARVLLLAAFPRGESADDPKRKCLDAVNAAIRAFADGKKVVWLDFGAKFLDEKGDTRWCMPDRLHPNAEAYRDIWLPEILPYFEGTKGRDK